ncbi:hypothetical protein PAV_5c02240 [Paenibacillus alvei DSM 29]|nr:hypothetical protein PAV_5c02240 [Paenibacillus alvei DSM 29]
MVDTLFIVLQVLLAAIGVYQFTLSLFGIYRKKEKKYTNRKNLSLSLLQRTMRKL